MRRRKRIFSTLAVVFCMMLQTLTAFAEQKDVSVFLDGDKLSFDVAPVIENGRTMVPMRAIFEAMGIDVTWDDAEKSITAVTKSNFGVKMTIGKKEASAFQMNTENHIDIKKDLLLDTAPEVVNGRTLIPLRFISETMGYDVEWNNAIRRVDITGTYPIRHGAVFGNTAQWNDCYAADLLNCTFAEDFYIVNGYTTNAEMSETDYYKVDSSLYLDAGVYLPQYVALLGNTYYDGMIFDSSAPFALWSDVYGLNSENIKDGDDPYLSKIADMIMVFPGGKVAGSLTSDMTYSQVLDNQASVSPWYTNTFTATGYFYYEICYDDVMITYIWDTQGDKMSLAPDGVTVAHIYG